MINLWNTDSFIPHGHCYLWNAELVSVHVISDLLIAVAYYSIPISLLSFGHKRKDFPYPNIIWLFSLFILACGTTHIMEIWTLWHADYWVSGLLKAVTAIISILTAFALIPLLSKALTLPSISQYRLLNQALEAEVLERKKIEIALTESEARHRSIVEGQSDLICRFLPNSIITFVNEPYCQYFNKSREELLNQSYSPNIYEPDRERVSRLVSLLTPENPILTIENRVVVNEEIRWMQWNNLLILDEQNQISEFQSVGRDITALKQQEEKYKLLSEERLQLALEASGDSLWDWDIAESYTYFSPQIHNILGFDSNDLGDRIEAWKALIHPLDRPMVMEQLQTHLKDSAIPYLSEYRIMTKGGQWKWIASYGKVVTRDVQGQPLRMVGVHRDIDFRKKFEKEIQSSLEEKKTLLKEIHHRVKNNLQVICSLLNLQSRLIDDNQLKSQLEDTQNRVRSMALVHERLYQSESLSKLNISEHVRDLLADLRRSFGKQIERIELQVNIATDLTLNMDMAIPFGLIINELVSNSFKYAFEPGKSGKIIIQAYLDKNQTLHISVKDNGRGLPFAFNIEKSKTLGLKLVKDLVEQFNGYLRFEEIGGTSFFVSMCSQ